MAEPSSIPTSSSAGSQWARLRSTINTSAALRANTSLDKETRKRNRKELQRHARASDDQSLSGGRVDDEGMNDQPLLGSAKRKASSSQQRQQQQGRPGDRRPLSGVERWEPLAHLLGDEQREAQRERRARRRQRDGAAGDEGAGQSTLSESRLQSPSPAPDRAIGSTIVVDEPQSTLNDDLGAIPYGKDPLEYADDKHLLDSDSDSDSDDDDEDGRKGAPINNCQEPKSTQVQPWLSSWRTPSPLFKGVTKCVVAYFLSSLFTYSSFLSTTMAHLLPNHDPANPVPFSNLHMIATVSVYFMPARSFGSMLEADIFAAIALTYSIALSLSSMLVAEWLHDLGHPNFSNVLSVVLFLGGGMALVGWAKVKVGKPTFNTACSLVFVSTFTVMVKEGSTHLGRFETDKVWQVA